MLACQQRRPLSHKHSWRALAIPDGEEEHDLKLSETDNDDKWHMITMVPDDIRRARGNR